MHERPGAPPVLGMIRAAVGDWARCAVVEPSGASFSYREIFAWVEHIRSHVRRAVPSGSRVALLLPRGAAQLASLLGVMDAGRVAVLIDPVCPRRRLHQMLADVDAKLVLTAPETSQLDLGRWSSVALDVESLDAIHKSESASVAPAYVIFTSGSTGVPKGVQVSHAGLLEHTRASVERFAMTAADVTVQFASPGFDVIIEEVFPTFAVGGRLVVRADPLWTPMEFVAFLTDHRITNLELPSGYWAALFWDQETRSDLVPNPELRFVNVGGEKTTRAALRNWRESPFRSIRLFNTYGPTEVIVSSNVYEVPSVLPVGVSDSVPLGQPLGARTMHVLRSDLPLGANADDGELAVGGAIADGYVNRPAETARAFITLDSGERVYRTGDRVRWVEPGNLEFLGRIDDQVKIRGYRVELGEVEAALVSDNRVLGVAAALDARGTALVAAIVLAPGVDLSDVRLTARDLLPAHMLPRMKAVEALPKLASGKLDRRAVTALFRA